MDKDKTHIEMGEEAADTFMASFSDYLKGFADSMERRLGRYLSLEEALRYIIWMDVNRIAVILESMPRFNQSFINRMQNHMMQEMDDHDQAEDWKE
jgi:hypothetical protein